MDELIKEIIDKRNIKSSTANCYRICLKKIQQAIEDNREFHNFDFLNQTENILDFLKKFKISTQKTYLASIVVTTNILGLNDINKFYTEKMQELIKKWNVINESGIKSESQEKNWCSLTELKSVLSILNKKIKDSGMLKKNEISKNNFQLYQQYLIANLFLECSPVRLDYANMKIISRLEYNKLDDKKKDNYLINESKTVKYFIFNSYKTSKTYGEVKLKINKKINKILNIWLKYNLSGYLLLNSKNEAMSSNALGKEITYIFQPYIKDKKVTVNLIRHIYISEHFPNDCLKKIQIASEMMHSTFMQGTYSKI